VRAILRQTAHEYLRWVQFERVRRWEKEDPCTRRRPTTPGELYFHAFGTATNIRHHVTLTPIRLTVDKKWARFCIQNYTKR